jgi:hypothetical protein
MQKLIVIKRPNTHIVDITAMSENEVVGVIQKMIQ